MADGPVLKKTFLQCLFGTPHDWLESYFEHFGRLESTGWYMKVFSPHSFDVPSNVEIVPMTLVEFDGLVEKKCGVNPGNYLDGHAPRKLISDYYVAFGHLLSDHILDADYWGITNFDLTYGRLSRYIPDETLEQFDIWTDDATPCVNGIFTLFKNEYRINRLYQHVPNWQDHFTNHAPCAFDEVLMTKAVRELAERGEIRLGHPEHFPFHSYDRLPQHRPTPQVYFEADGALIEKFEDPGIGKSFLFPRGFHGREIMMLHWSRTKRWPISTA